MEKDNLTIAEQAKLFLLGRRGEAASTAEDHPSLTRVYLEDENMDQFRLVMVLSERLAYAFVGSRKSEDEYFGFHTHDHFLVENLIARLQDYYNFQPQY